jgi:hypothetical protein
MKNMSVAENNNIVHGMLEEEYERCVEVSKALEDKVSQYPKGALNIRKKSHNGKEYSYFYIVSRENGHVINRHVSSEEAPKLKEQIKERDKNLKEIKAYKKRIAYLEKLLKIKK